MNWSKLLQDPKTWLAAIGISMIAIHLTLIGQIDNLDFWGTSAFLWGGAAFLLWEKQDQLHLESGIFASFFGATLLGLTLFKSSFLYGYDIFLRFFPFITLVSLGLLASGFKGLKQYWQQFVILSFIAIPPGLILKFIPLELMTAKVSAIFLWYLGFPLELKGTLLTLPTGSVDVYDGCAGVNVIFQLLGLTFLFIFMFPEIKPIHKVIAPIVATLVAFLVNAARVALLAVIVSDKEAFEYWHFGEGSLIFSMIAVLLFGIFCWFFILREPPQKQESI